MKYVTFVACDHTGEIEESVKTLPGNRVMDACPRCLAVQSVDELFAGYPCGYRMKYGKSILAVVKEISEDSVIVATSQFKPGQMNYQEWAVQKSDFRRKGAMLTADPFGTVK